MKQAILALRRIAISFHKEAEALFENGKGRIGHEVARATALVNKAIFSPRRS